MRAILFDFGGTLDADGTTWIDRFFPLYKDEGLTPPREAFDKAFYASDDNLAKRFPLAGLGLEETLRLQVRCVLETLADRKAARRPETDASSQDEAGAIPDGPGERVVQRFLADCRKHFRRNRPVLERLRRRYRLGIVSNFYGNLDAVLDAEGLLEYFDVLADSGVVGAEKPSPAIFLHAAKSLGVEAADCLMVGDSVRRDMRGAEGLGMPHALIASDPAAACCPAAWVLADITRLEARLEQA
ncbi:MAG: HAD family hydrolase [Elusimicrobiota bacterium]|jgi:putative hydrolase of the HAD superfamily